jgi:hypothetical protein
MLEKSQPKVWRRAVEVIVGSLLEFTKLTPWCLGLYNFVVLDFVVTKTFF